MNRKRRTISYPTQADTDLDELLERLQSFKDSPYWNRSLSDIGGMILFRSAQAEVKKYTKKLNQSPDKKKASDADAE
ncbi:MAG: hypothetical protein HYX87_07220 [Chloroflexi bacterium]|nr:hypothetical protein [Chloroflexota bacterium]